MNIKILAKNIVNNPSDFTAEHIEKYFEDYVKLRLSAVSGWLLFRDVMPELNQKIEIYWSTDEITKQIWRNDIPWTSNELPRFWRACH